MLNRYEQLNYIDLNFANTKLLLKSGYLGRILNGNKIDE